MRGIVVLVSCILLGTLSGYATGTASDPTQNLKLDAAALADPPLGTPLQGLLPEFRLGSFTHMAEILPSRRVPRGGPVVALARDEHSIGDVTYRLGTDDNTAFVSWSVAKTFTSTLVGIAQADGAIKSIDDKAASYAPALADLRSERIWRKLGAEHDASRLLDRRGGKAQLLPAARIREATRTIRAMSLRLRPCRRPSSPHCVIAAPTGRPINYQNVRSIK